MPTLFPVWQQQKEGEERVTVVSEFQQWQQTSLELTEFKWRSAHQKTTTT